MARDKRRNAQVSEHLLEEHDAKSGFEAWKHKEESKSYDYVNIRTRIDALKEFRRQEDDIGLLFALNEGIHGNQGGMGKSILYKLAKFGTKHFWVNSKRHTRPFFIFANSDLL